jgi:hypothetical protein
MNALRNVTLRQTARAIALLGVVVLHGTASAQISDDARSTVSPKQLVVSRDCNEARRIISTAGELNKLNAEARQEIFISLENCVVAEANAANAARPEEQQITVVGPTETGRIFFKTIKRSDANAVADACKDVSRGLTAAIPGLAAKIVSVATDAGRVQCDAYLKAAEQDNPLLILAPTYITTPAITVHVLRLVGLGKPADEVQKAANDAQKRVGEVARSTVAEIKKHPLILLAGPAGVATTVAVKAVGKNACRLKIKCNGFKCRHTC